MRHAIQIIVCCITLVTIQGLALADDGGVPPPPLPPAPSCTGQTVCPAPDTTDWGQQCSKSLADSSNANLVLQKDLEDAIQSKCDRKVVADIAKRHGIVVHKKHRKTSKTPSKPKTTPKAVDGKDGKDGVDGRDGRDGKDGLSWLWTIEDDTKGAGCNGGYKLLGGLDVDSNGNLDIGEATEESDCYGMSASAADGHDGRDGKDGTKVRVGPIVNVDFVDSATEPKTFYSGVGLGLQVQNGRWEWSGAGSTSPALAGGRMLKTSLTYFVTRRLGATLGVEGVWAGLDSENRAASQFVGATPGLTLRLLDSRSWKVEMEAHAFIGQSMNGDGEKSLATGAGATLGISYQF